MRPADKHPRRNDISDELSANKLLKFHPLPRKRSAGSPTAPILRTWKVFTLHSLNILIVVAQKKKKKIKLLLIDPLAAPEKLWHCLCRILLTLGENQSWEELQLLPLQC